eukprot:TRINITY_DN3805_c0_g1_i7.p1 TRINITY_DN3805_c0_g1~~TRINITY_DN3805_c0_g1_i7.p1  ORF type:complete len:162 (+),score=41.72 TRINITY_DN3805_c0_g1_i7:177-662(+)
MHSTSSLKVHPTRKAGAFYLQQQQNAHKAAMASMKSCNDTAQPWTLRSKLGLKLRKARRASVEMRMECERAAGDEVDECYRRVHKVWNGQRPTTTISSPPKTLELSSQISRHRRQSLRQAARGAPSPTFMLGEMICDAQPCYLGKDTGLDKCIPPSAHLTI